VLFNEASPGPFTLGYTLRDGTATKNAPSPDYAIPVGGAAVAVHTGDTSETINIPIVNDTLVEGNEYFNIWLNPSPYFLPADPSAAAVAIIDDDPGPVVQFRNPWIAVLESSPYVSLQVVLNKSYSQAVSVQYTTTGPYTATPGSDFAPVSGTLNFPANSLTPQTINVPIVQDNITENEEIFYVQLFNVSGNAQLIPTLALEGVVIVDQRPAPVVQFSASNYSFDEGTGNATLTVNMTPQPTGPVDIAYTLTGVTATLDGSPQSDVTGPYNGVVTFVPDPLQSATATLSQTITVPIVDDALAEFDETFQATLTPPLGPVTYGGNPTTATVTIKDNDSAAPRVSFESLALPENIGTTTIQASLDRRYSFPVKVQYKTTDVTATSQPPNPDYVAIPLTTLTFPALTNSTDLPAAQAVSVTINNDSLVEPPETFTISAQAPGDVPSQNNNFLYQGFADLFRRPIDQGGLTFWSGVLQTYSRPVTAKSLLLTSESEGDVLSDVYQKYFSRPVDPGGNTYWSSFLRAFGNNEAEA
jgi:hypothetical protein